MSDDYIDRTRSDYLYELSERHLKEAESALESELQNPEFRATTRLQLLAGEILRSARIVTVVLEDILGELREQGSRR